jgi:hypothetical protein
MIPSRISGWPNSARSEATIMSQASASSQPPPRAYPDTAATSGVRSAASRGQKRAAGEVSTSAKVRLAIALMSAPAANHPSPPAITMQRTSGSSSQRSHSEASSSINSADSALRASGRSSRARPTAPRISAETVPMVRAPAR